MSELFKLIKRMGVWRKYIILLLLRAPFDALRTWMYANLMKSFFSCLEMGNSDSLLKISIIYGLICAMLFVYNGIVWSKYAAFAAKTESWLQNAMLEKILSLSLKRIDCEFSGEWITKLNSDIHAVFAMMNDPLNMPHLVVAVINTVVSSFLMFRSSGLLFGVTWIFVILQLIINYKIVLRLITKLKEESQKAMAENTSAISPFITEAYTILLYDAGGLMMKRCKENSEKLMKINMKMHMRKALNDACMRLLGIGGYVIILLIGYKFIHGRILAFSDVVYCFQVRGSIIAGMSMFITCLNNLKANSVCVKRIHDIYE